MAIIKLSEIPNAPQGVNNYTLNPQFSGDQVGNEAKADIARGFQGQMQDTQNAGIVGKAIAGLGGDITSSAGNFSSAALYYKKGKDRQAEAEGFATYYGNKTAIEDEYYSRINDPNNPIPVESRAGIWLDVTQKGQRFLQGMPADQQHAYGIEATKDFYAGITTASNEVNALKKQEYATNQLTQFQNALTGKDWANARIAVATGVKTGAFTPEDGLRYETTIKTNEQFQNLIGKMNDDPTGKLYKSVMSAGEQGVTLKDAPDLSSENLVKLGKVGEAIYNQNLWANNVEKFKNEIDLKHIIDPNQLKGNKMFEDMPEPQKAAVLARLTNNRAGTKEGAAYAAGGQSLVNTYPKDPNNKSNELLEYKTWILGNVPEPAASAQIAALDKKYNEMVNNGGNLKPETEVATNLSRGVNAYLKGQMFGDYSENPTDGTESQASTKAADAANSVKIQVMNGGKIGNTTYPSGPPATSHEAYQRLQSAMQKRIQASDASELFKKKEQHGAIWKFFHPSSPASAPSAELPENSTSSLNPNALPEGLRPFAKDFVEAGVKYNIDPAFLAAIAWNETGGGTSKAFRQGNNAMGISNAKGPLYGFGSPAESIHKQAATLARASGPYRNTSTIQEVGSVYSPVGAANDPLHLNGDWTNSVGKFYSKLTGRDSNSRVLHVKG